MHIMISFKKANRELYAELSQELKKLYLEAFTKGASAQLITNADAELYLKNLFLRAYGIFGFSDENLIAALIVSPPSSDKERPENIRNLYNDNDTEYIAEVLVDENFRGLGIGKKLLEEFEKQLDSSIKYVLLRVWDKNEAAVGLYKKFGFEICGSITQKKIKPNSKESFMMNKYYMIKSY